MQWGSRFHLLMQQRELTLPIESLLATDSELDSSLKALIQAAPELLEQNPIFGARPNTVGHLVLVTFAYGYLRFIDC